MSLSSQVSSLATRLGQEVKALWLAINAKAPIDSPTFTNNVVNNGAYIRVSNASGSADMEIKSSTSAVYHVMKASNSSGTGNIYTEYWKSGTRYWLLTVTDAAYTLGYRDSGGSTVNAISFDRSTYPGRALLNRSTVAGDTALTIATKDYVDSKVAKITSTDNAIARYDSTAGALQNSAVTIDDNGKIVTVASASGFAPIKIAPGTAPSSPIDGDVWNVAAGLYYRNGSVTQHIPRVSISGTAPASPVDGDLWIDNSTREWTAWTPSIYASTSPTVTGAVGKYARYDNIIIGWGICNVTYANRGSGGYLLSLPVAPKQRTDYPRMGQAQVSLAGSFVHMQLELYPSSNYCQPLGAPTNTWGSLMFLNASQITSGNTMGISYAFWYEAA
jgi:hypothetical protein